MNNRLFAHIPYHFLRENLSLATERRINPEIFLPAEVLDALIPEELSAIAEALGENGLQPPSTAPSWTSIPDRSSLSSGRPPCAVSTRPWMPPQSSSRGSWSCIPATTNGATAKARTPGSRTALTGWRKWSPERAVKIGCVIAVENIFEEEPATLRALLETFESPLLRHCFDVGHWNMFKKVGMEEWFAELGPYIAETHIHDNFGIKDDHAPIGEGNIDFELFFSLMERYAPAAAWTIEAHSREALERSLVNIEKYRNP